MAPQENDLRDETDAKKSKVRTHTPRPDELSRETFEFISAVDEYKRRHMRSFLDDREVIEVLQRLGYRRPGFGASDPSEAELEDYSEARRRYRIEEGRLFPTWSEVFGLLMGLGYSRHASENAA